MLSIFDRAVVHIYSHQANILHLPLLHEVRMQSSSNPSQDSGWSSTFFACVKKTHLANEA